VLPTVQDRTNFIGHLAQRGVQATFHYVPLHTAPMGRRVGTAPLGAPVTEDIAARLVRLPLFTDLCAGDQDYVIDAVIGFQCGQAAEAS
jgi:dTDP-4-amino-4,6-dideoxygalactose transaminase